MSRNILFGKYDVKHHFFAYKYDLRDNLIQICSESYEIFYFVKVVKLSHTLWTTYQKLTNFAKCQIQSKRKPTNFLTFTIQIENLQKCDISTQKHEFWIVRFHDLINFSYIRSFEIYGFQNFDISIRKLSFEYEILKVLVIFEMSEILKL